MTIGGETQADSGSAGLRSRINHLLHRRATWFVIDQAIVSGGNFLTINLVTRRLTEEHNGIFGLVIETMLYLNTIQAALVIYPLTIRGATGNGDNIGKLASTSLIFTFALLPILGLAIGTSVIAAVAGTAGSTPLMDVIRSHSFMALAAVAAMFLGQVQETLRRAQISDLRFSEAVWGDSIRYLGQTALVGTLFVTHRLTLHNAYWMMGLSAAFATLLQARQVGIVNVTRAQLAEAMRDFWKLGKWMLPSNASGVITALGYWWTLKLAWGAAACGIFYAVVQIFKLANPVINSMSNIITPAVARAASQDGMAAARRVALRYIALGGVPLALYFLILVCFPKTALHLFYGSDKYVEYSVLLQLFVASYAATYISTTTGAWLQGLGYGKRNFYTQIVTVLVSLFIGLPCTYKWGTYGFTIGGFFAALSTAIVTVYYINVSHKNPGSDPDSVTLATDSSPQTH